MPELPEVETVRRSLLPHLVGQSIVEVWARDIRLRAGIEPEQWWALRGHQCTDLQRRGKYLIASFGEYVAVIHLGMSGRLILTCENAQEQLHTHLKLRLSSSLDLRYIDPRRFGVALVLPSEGMRGFEPLNKLGPDPFEGELHVHLLKAAKCSRVPIRNLLLDQRVLAGIGNIYANEALARAGIRPDRKSNRIGEARVLRLASAIREVLQTAIVAGGTTLKDGGFVDGIGDAGHFAIQLSVYGREGQACSSCGQAILRASLSGRSLFYCSSCQH